MPPVNCDRSPQPAKWTGREPSGHRPSNPRSRSHVACTDEPRSPHPRRRAARGGDHRGAHAAADAAGLQPGAVGAAGRARLAEAGDGQPDQRLQAARRHQPDLAAAGGRAGDGRGGRIDGEPRAVDRVRRAAVRGAGARLRAGGGERRQGGVDATAGRGGDAARGALRRRAAGGGRVRGGAGAALRALVGRAAAGGGRGDGGAGGAGGRRGRRRRSWSCRRAAGRAGAAG